MTLSWQHSPTRRGKQVRRKTLNIEKPLVSAGWSSECKAYLLFVMRSTPQLGTREYRRVGAAFG